MPSMEGKNCQFQIIIIRYCGKTFAFKELIIRDSCTLNVALKRNTQLQKKCARIPGSGCTLWYCRDSECQVWEERHFYYDNSFLKMNAKINFNFGWLKEKNRFSSV